MKIENGKLVFEEVICWECGGKKEVKRYKTCPLWNKPVRNHGGTCPHCGAKNRYSHKTVGEYIISCPSCEGKGTRMQNAYDLMTQEEWLKLLPNFTFTVARNNRGANFNENYLGLGVLYGWTDYTDWTTKTNEEVLAFVPSSGHPSQPLQFCNKITLDVHTNLIIILRQDGFSVVAKKQ